MNTQKIRELLDKRDALDDELRALIGGTPTRKPQKCSRCHEEGHSARTCTKPE